MSRLPPDQVSAGRRTHLDHDAVRISTFEKPDRDVDRAWRIGLLKRMNLQDFVILERADDVGGTWRDNTYPGIGVDIPVFAYQFSYELKPDWSRFFPKGHEVKEYVDDYVAKYEIRPHVRFNSEVRSRTWDEENHLWRLDVNALGSHCHRWSTN